METRIRVGDHLVDRMGFGAMRVMAARGADGGPSRRAAVELVRRVVELGVTFIDTADIYGDGESEEIIAEALHPYPADVLIATKGGFVPGERKPGVPSLPQDCRPERLRRVCEDSLRRLGVDRIDLYQLHTPDPEVPFEDSVGALVELRDEGKIAHIGLSNIGRRHLATALELTPIASVQNRYNHTDRSSEKVLEMCADHDIVFLPWGPIQTGDDDVLAVVAAELDASPQQTALAWLLHHSPAMLPIPGTSSILHLEENVAARDIRLTERQLAHLEGA